LRLLAAFTSLTHPQPPPQAGALVAFFRLRMRYNLRLCNLVYNHQNRLEIPIKIGKPILWNDVFVFISASKIEEVPVRAEESAILTHHKGGF